MRKNESAASEINPEIFSRPRLGVAAEKWDPSKPRKSKERKRIPKNPNEAKQIYSSIKNIFLFDALSDSDMHEIIEYMFPIEVKKNDVIIKEKDSGDYFYVICKGEFEVEHNGSAVRRYKDVGYFGELSLLYNMPRSATVKAVIDGKLWGLDTDTFREFVLEGAYERRTKFDNIINNIELMKSLPKNAKELLIDSLSFYTYNDSVLFKEGELNDKFFIVETGLVNLTKNNTIKKTLVSGQFFGEESLLFNRPSSFTAVTKGHTCLGYLEKLSFNSVVQSINKDLKNNCEKLLKTL